MTVESDPRPINACLLPEAWPVVDQRLWHEATAARKSPFRKNGGGKTRSPYSVKLARSCYGRFIRFLEIYYPEQLTLPVPVRLSDTVLDAYFQHLQALGNADYTVVWRFAGLRMAMRWMFPGQDFRFVTSPGGVPLTRLLEMKRKPHRAPHTVVLLDFARQLYQAALRIKMPRRRCAQLRDAVIIGILATPAPRSGTMSKLRLGTHVYKIGDEWIIDQHPDITKTGRATGTRSAMPLEPEVGGWLERYIDVERIELLAGQQHDALWVACGGGPMAYDTLARTVGGRTKRHFGFSTHPHAFRASLATSEASCGSANPLDASALLGHSGPETTLKHYNRNNGYAAAHRHADRLRKMRGI